MKCPCGKDLKPRRKYCTKSCFIKYRPKALMQPQVGARPIFGR